MTRSAKLLAAGLGLVGLYAFGVRPRLVRWGATAEEVSRQYPGSALIPGGTRSATTAATVDAPPSAIWPWLVQMGVDRAGWYSWDRLDNFGRRSAKRIHPEWQQITVGDRLTATPDGGMWWEVAACEPDSFLLLRMSLDLRGRPFDPRGPRPRFYSDSTWGWLLEELPGGRTRIIESGYWCLRPRWLQPIAGFLFIEPEHWVMQTRQFANLKRRIKHETGRPWLEGGDPGVSRDRQERRADGVEAHSGRRPAQGVSSDRAWSV
jgi:proline iminopeptidase